MRKAEVNVGPNRAATLIEHTKNKYELKYEEGYKGPAISLTLPLKKKMFSFDAFPAFFEGLLPEGVQLEALLRKKKIDRNDYFSQLIAVGEDMVGAVGVREIK